MRNLLSVVLLGAVSACATPGPPTLAEIVRGPTRVCMERVAFNLPATGTIVQAEKGRLGTHLTGMIGPDAFEITESASFAAAPVAETVVYQGANFTVRQVGDLPGSYAIYSGTGNAQETRPAVRVEHYFGTDSITIADFFAGYDPAGAAQQGCGRRL